MVYSTLLFFQGCEAPLGRGGSGSNFQLNNADELFTTDTKKVERWRWIRDYRINCVNFQSRLGRAYSLTLSSKIVKN